MCDNSCITGTQVGVTVCKPCEGRVSRVKIVFYALDRTIPYLTVLGTVKQSYKNRVQILPKP